MFDLEDFFEKSVALAKEIFKKDGAVPILAVVAEKDGQNTMVEPLIENEEGMTQFMEWMKDYLRGRGSLAAAILISVAPCKITDDKPAFMITVSSPSRPSPISQIFVVDHSTSPPSLIDKGRLSVDIVAGGNTVH